MNQSETPLYEALLKHREKAVYSFHVPGHKNGMLIHPKGEHLYKDIMSIDVTELSGLDDLHAPEGVIFEAEKLLSELYGVEKSFLLVNGSTVGNLAMILSTVGEGEVVLVQRNCHKSVLHALQMAKANAIFIEPTYHRKWQVAGGLEPRLVKEALSRYPNAVALIVTNPNYYGMVTDLEEIIHLCHSQDVAVLVDEAHGAHFKRVGICPPSATDLGADLVVQSAHKTLPAMTMGSYLHFNSQLVDQKKVASYLHMLQSSSPSYPIMASLDLARAFLATYTEEDVVYAYTKIMELRRHLGQIPAIQVLAYKPPKGDPFKITIQSKTRLSGFDLQRRLEEQGIHTELADVRNVLLLFPLLKQGIPYDVEEMVGYIRKAVDGEEVLIQESEYPYSSEHPYSSLYYSYLEQEDKEIMVLPVQKCVNTVSAEMIVPYPPGIPLLLPGEIITEHHVRQLTVLQEVHARFQGGSRLNLGELKVFKMEEDL